MGYACQNESYSIHPFSYTEYSQAPCIYELGEWSCIVEVSLLALELFLVVVVVEQYQ